MDKSPCPAKTPQEFKRDLVIWACEDLLPFNFIEKSGLQKFFKKNLPDRQLPSEATLRTSALLDVYHALRVEIMKELESIDTICVMFDGWTDRHHAHPFIGLRISYIKPNWISRVVTLSCKVLFSHTADAIADHVKKEIDTFFKGRHMKIFSTHDGAKNVVKASKLLRVEQYHHCVAHALHLLLMTDSLNRVDEIRDILLHCKEIVNTLHFKGQLLEDEIDNEKDRAMMELLEKRISLLHNEQSLDDLSPVTDDSDEGSAVAGNSHKSLKASVATRWNSSLSMISSILDLFGQVNETLKRIGHRELVLLSAEKDLLTELCHFLGNFKEFTDLVSGSQPHLGLILMIKEDIKRLVNNTNAGHPAIDEIKLLIKTKIDERLKVTDSVNIACILDPSLKDFIQLSNAEKSTLLLSACAKHPLNVETEQLAGDNNDIPHLATPSKRQKLLDRFRASVGDTSKDDLETEVSRYLAMPQPATSTALAPLEFWATSCQSFPHLAHIARHYLCVMPASVSVESMFSTTGLIMNGRRAALSPCKLNYVSFIHDNYQLFC